MRSQIIRNFYQPGIENCDGMRPGEPPPVKPGPQGPQQAGPKTGLHDEFWLSAGFGDLNG